MKKTKVPNSTPTRNKLTKKEYNQFITLIGNHIGKTFKKLLKEEYEGKEK